MSAAPAASPFDALAAGYDASFTSSAVGRRMRAALWRRYDAGFAAGASVLDLGCGTGEDALHLASRGVSVLGVDAAPAMVAEAERKAAAAGVSVRPAFRALPIERLSELAGSHFDGAYSSFGALNCVDLAAAGAALAGLLPPRAPAILCLMGRHVPWEWAYYGAKGDRARAFRRLARGGREWRGLLVRYPTPRQAARSLSPWFETRRAWALGALVPPTYVEGWASRHPRALALLDRVERALERVPPLPSLSDHYVLELERRGT